MGVLSSIGRLFKAIWKAIVDFVKKYFWIILLIILIVCAIYFAPLIAGWLTSVGAPTWLSSAFTWIGTNITPLLSMAWEGITTIAGYAYDAFSASSIGTKASLVLGAAAAIAPEETAELIGSVGELAFDGIGAVVGGVLNSPIGLPVVAFLAWWFLFRKRETAIIADSSELPTNSTPEVSNG